VETLGELLEYNAAFNGERLAIDVEGRRLTHGEFLERARRLADGLRSLGVRRQDRVAVLAMNGLEILEVYAACEWAGYIAATVNFRLAAPEVEFILGDAAPKLLVFEARYLDLVAELRTRLAGIEHFVCIGGEAPGCLRYEDLIESGEAARAQLCARADDVVQLIYTSGTTGRPKGCAIAQRAALWKARTHVVDMGLTAQDRMLLTMPLFHIGAKGLQLAAHYRAGAAYVHRVFEPARMLEAIERERITGLHLAPTMIQALLECPAIDDRDVSSVKLICYSAAPMPVPVLRKGIARFGPVFHQAYGQTEGSCTVLLRHQHDPEGDEKTRGRLASAGQPMPGVRLRIVGDDGRDLPQGDVGEIVYRSPSAFLGYWNNSAATLDTLRDGWIWSGDMGRLDEEGFLYIVDRKKDVIVSGGENIYAREVEDALCEHPGVAEAAVIGVPDAKWGEAVRAIVVKRAGAAPGERELIEHCRTRIASYKKPQSIVFADSLPKLANGKIDKRALRAAQG